MCFLVSSFVSLIVWFYPIHTLLKSDVFFFFTRPFLRHTSGIFAYYLHNWTVIGPWLQSTCATRMTIHTAQVAANQNLISNSKLLVLLVIN